MTKRVLIFSLAYYPKYVGGAEVAIKEITDRIDSRDIEFDMVCLRFDKRLPKVEKIGNVTVHRIGLALKCADISKTYHPLFYLAKVLYVPLAALNALKLHREQHFDAMWAMMAYMTFPIALMRLVGVRVPHVLTLQEGDPFERVFDRWYIKMFKPLLLIGFRKAVVVQTISTFLATWARDMGFKGDLEIIPNAVNTEHFSQAYAQEELDALKQRLGKVGDNVYLITTSRLVKKNAVDDVIRSLAFLPEKFKFLVLGIGPDEKMLRTLAREHGVGDRVMFLGQVDHKEMPKYLQVSDIFTRPSLSEGMGNSFVEAMAAGLPVVATQEGGIADFLFDPDRNPDKKPTGLAVAPRDPEGLARQFKRLMENPGLRERIAKNARELAFTKYDWNKIANDIKTKVFEKVLD